MDKQSFSSNKEAVKMGFLPGIIATLCCLGPLILIMLGLASASTALSFAMYNRYFIVLGIVILSFSLWFFIRKRRQIICSGCSTKQEERWKIFYLIIFSASISVLIYGFIFYLILPWLSPIIYENFYMGK